MGNMLSRGRRTGKDKDNKDSKKRFRVGGGDRGRKNIDTEKRKQKRIEQKRRDGDKRKREEGRRERDQQERKYGREGRDREGRGEKEKKRIDGKKDNML